MEMNASAHKRKNRLYCKLNMIEDGELKNVETECGIQEIDNKGFVVLQVTDNNRELLCARYSILPPEYDAQNSTAPVIFNNYSNNVNGVMVGDSKRKEIPVRPRGGDLFQKMNFILGAMYWDLRPSNASVLIAEEGCRT